jgi:two-component system, NarL family, nitrate/nitrite response regulator NarL
VTLQIVLADDHAVFRECLARALGAAGHSVVAEASDGDAAVAAVQRWRPDVAVLDVSMPGCDGIAATRRIASFGVPVIVLTMHADAEVRERARDAGARDLLVKDCKTSDLLAALEGAAQPRSAPAPKAPALSAREQEVLGLLASGATPPDIASRLYISSVTVKNHLASIYRKLGCRGRTQAVIYALQHGLVAE